MGNSVSEELQEAAKQLREARYPDCLAKLQSLQAQELDEAQRRHLKDLMGQALFYMGHAGRALRYLPPSSPLVPLAQMTTCPVATSVDVPRCCALVEQLCKMGMVGRAQHLAQRLVAAEKTSDTLLALVVSLTARSARDELEQAAAVLEQMTPPLSQRARFYLCAVLSECGKNAEALEAALQLSETPRHLLLRARISSRAKLSREAAELYEQSWRGSEPGEAVDAACSCVLERLKCGELSEAMRVFRARFVPGVPKSFVAENVWDREEQLAIEERMRRVAPLFSEMIGLLARALCEGDQVAIALHLAKQWRALTVPIKHRDEVALCEWAWLMLRHGQGAEQEVHKALYDALEQYAHFYNEANINKAPATRELAVLLVLLTQSSRGTDSPYEAQLKRVLQLLGFPCDEDWEANYARLAFHES
jgi:hypothetical protein